jgi:hypothetical protein
MTAEERVKQVVQKFAEQVLVNFVFLSKEEMIRLVRSQDTRTELEKLVQQDMLKNRIYGVRGCILSLIEFANEDVPGERGTFICYCTHPHEDTGQSFEATGSSL